MDSALCPANAGISSGLLVAAISRYRPKQTQYTTDGPPASQAERIAAVRQRHGHGLVLAASLIGDVAAALGEHVLATLDEHCGYFRRRGRGQADRVNTATSAAGPL